MSERSTSELRPAPFLIQIASNTMVLYSATTTHRSFETLDQARRWKSAQPGLKQREDGLTGRKEGNVLFNDALNTFYLRLYGVIHMVKDYSDSER